MLHWAFLCKFVPTADSQVVERQGFANQECLVTVLTFTEKVCGSSTITAVQPNCDSARWRLGSQKHFKLAVGELRSRMKR